MRQAPMLDLRLEYEYMKSEIDSAIRRCLEHQKWILGPEVGELENKMAGYLGVKHCIGVSSGTEALILALRALAIRTKGREYFDRTDLIITTPFTFTATGDAILRSGATPVFIDIDPQTYNIDTAKIRQYLEKSGEGVVGIIPVHLYGQACRMDEISDIASERGLFIIEDVAQAFGGMWRGRKLGAIGTAGCFSFFPSKNLGGFGDGGMVSTGDDETAGIIRMLLKHGGRDKYNVDHIGYNARLDTLQAAVLLAKFAYIDEFNSKRRKIAEKYNENLAGLEGISLPLVKNPDAFHVYHQYTVRVEDREMFQSKLREKGISTMVYYPYPLHKMKVFGEGRSLCDGGLEQAEKAALGVLSLPVEPLQSEETTSYVAGMVRDIFTKGLTGKTAAFSASPAGRGI
ncbi:MAG: DegT/DnrJ/EryC1/StrS family aminotransferase [Nitrospiraceae bacterium]|nr:DegT/DnrJ/EryC1/StrS family aminotransferase [Nitrospiraceae bacterium]